MPTAERPLSSYAAHPSASRGRRHAEPEHAYRDCFERDRDRIIHSRAFRRLEYKTQVFPNHHGDHFRTRLTHTIEVAQLARTVARALAINSTLSEAIALAHDLGHPPFGHVGEEVLDEMMQEAGGFEHNRHTLRTVDEIEEKYAGFRGLNLTYEVREAIAKHTTRYDRFSGPEIKEFRPQERPPLEAQIIDLVDHIAYNVHDLDDGVEAHVLDVATLRDEVALFGRIYRRLENDLPSATRRELLNESIRHLIDLLVTDLIETTSQAVRDSGAHTLEDIRSLEHNLAAHSPDIERDLGELAGSLSARLYRSPLVHEQMEAARAVLSELFERLLDDPSALPSRHRERAERVGTRVAIADYVAGMTDRFVSREHARVTGSATRG